LRIARGWLGKDTGGSFRTGVVDRGWVCPNRPQFVTEKIIEIRCVAPDRLSELQAARLRELFERTGVRKSMGLNL
jgi:hypothetical protein